MKILCNRLSFLLIIVLTLPSILGAVGKVSPGEEEDRDLIRQLFGDKEYEYAEIEGRAYLGRYKKGFFRDEIYFVLGQSYLNMGQTEEALSYYNQILKEFPRSEFAPDALYTQGTLLVRLGRREEGEKSLRRLLREFPKSRFRKKLFFPLGIIDFYKRDWAAAQKNLEAAEKIGDLTREQDLELRNYLAWTHHFQGRTERARQMFVMLLDSELQQETKAKIAFQLAVDAYQKGSFQEAIHWHQRQMKEWSDPTFQDQSRFWVAESYYWLHQQTPKNVTNDELELAAKFYTENLASPTPLQPDLSHYHRGWIFAALGKEREAEADFSLLQQQVEQYRSETPLTIYRGSYFERLRDWASANQIYRARIALGINAGEGEELWGRIIRNEFYQKSCPTVLAANREANVQFGEAWKNEIQYYLGKCYFAEESWVYAHEAFSKIDRSTSYGPLIFDEYLVTLQALKDLPAAIALIQWGLEGFVDQQDKKTQLLLLQTQFFEKLARWAEAINGYEITLRWAPKKAEDSWFLIHLAELYDKIDESGGGLSGSLGALSAVSNPAERSLKLYEDALSKLPYGEETAKLSLLDLLVRRYEKRANYPKVAQLYEDALPLIQEEKKKDLLRSRMAKIYLDRLGKEEEGEKRLWELHLKGSEELYLNASLTLAERRVSKGQYPLAIRVFEDLATKLRLQGTRFFDLTHYRLGELYQTTEKWEESLANYRLVVQSGNQDTLVQQSKQQIQRIESYLAQLEERKKIEALRKEMEQKRQAAQKLAEEQAAAKTKETNTSIPKSDSGAVSK